MGVLVLFWEQEHLSSIFSNFKRFKLKTKLHHVSNLPKGYLWTKKERKIDFSTSAAKFNFAWFLVTFALIIKREIQQQIYCISKEQVDVRQIKEPIFSRQGFNIFQAHCASYALIFSKYLLLCN